MSEHANGDQNQYEVLYSYTTPSFQERSHSFLWYATFALIGLILLVYAIVSRSPIMFIVFLLLIVLTVFLLRQKPEEIQVDILDKGIRVDQDTVYLYTNIKFFGILYDDDSAAISLFLNKGAMRYVKIPLGNENPEDIAAIIEQFVEREDNQESFIDKLDSMLRL
ncbi:MAG: hypothetical protein ABEI13_02960 [Candidatus Paceibacteria bacterium]